MWRVSYQEDNAKAWKWGEEQFDLRQAAEARATALEATVMALEEVLRLSERFIVNGCELGFIQMPEFSDDPAHKTLPAIRAALAQSGEG
jgi:hypothetical protein